MKNGSTAVGMRSSRSALIVEIETESYVARAFRAMKMKIGWHGFTGTNFRQLLNQPDLCMVTPAEDIQRVATVREALGPNRRLMVDANCVWSPATAIAGYETEIGLYGYRELIARSAIDIGQPDLVWSCGFSECRRIAAFAQAHNMMPPPHCFSSALLFVSDLHFAASIPNALMIVWDQTPHALRTELLNEPFDYDGAGFMRVLNGPGLGVTLNRDTIERYRVA